MKIECKLIGPMTLQLRRPMTSPVEESEFYVIGQLSYKKERMQAFQMGIVGGFGLCALLFTLLEKLFGK